MKNQVGARVFFDPKIIRFLSTGLLNTIFGYAVYSVLIFLTVPYLTALLVATITGVIFNYFSFGRLVFRGHGGRLVFMKFFLAYGVIYAANAVFLSVLTNELILNPYVAQAVCVPPSVILSWLLMNYWVYKK